MVPLNPKLKLLQNPSSLSKKILSDKEGFLSFRNAGVVSGRGAYILLFLVYVGIRYFEFRV